MQLQFCLVHHLKAGKSVPQHTHAALEIVYYVEGRGTSTVDGRLHQVGRNTFTVTPAGVYHDQVNITDLTSICLGLAGSGLEPWTGFYADEGLQLRRVCERMAFEISGKATGYQRLVDGLALQAAGLVERIATGGDMGASAKTSAAGKRIVEQALALIADSEGAISVAELADKLYLSKDYLRHLFRERASSSPLRHIIARRIERAKNLLTDRSLSMQAVAEQSGFETVYYFSRMFKKETGQTPTAFRAAL